MIECLEVLKDFLEVQAKEIVEALKVLNKEFDIMTPEKRVKEWMDFASKRQKCVDQRAWEGFLKHLQVRGCCKIFNFSDDF